MGRVALIDFKHLHVPGRHATPKGLVLSIPLYVSHGLPRCAVTEATLSGNGRRLAEAVRRGRAQEVVSIIAESPQVVDESDLLGEWPA
jgi:hypothetical protein